jgi:hypothetical protein
VKTRIGRLVALDATNNAVIGYIDLLGTCENASCVRYIANGEAIHTTPAAPGVTLNVNHFATIDEALDALESLP